MTEEELEEEYEGYEMSSEELDELYKDESSFSDDSYDGKLDDFDDRAKGPVYQVNISVMQRFMQENSINFVLERNPKDKADLAKGPICDDICVVGGERSFNEFSTERYLPAGTKLRIWLVQEKPTKCVEFQLLLSIKELMTDQSE